MYLFWTKPLPVSGISQGTRKNLKKLCMGTLVPTICFCFSYDSKTTK